MIPLAHVLCRDFVTHMAAQWIFTFFLLEPRYVPDKWTSNKQNIPTLLQRTYILSTHCDDNLGNSVHESQSEPPGLQSSKVAQGKDLQ